jgi:DNA (cytosine-5)-methyltransferase 1
MFENAGLMLGGVVNTARTTVAPTTDYTRYTGCRGPLTLADVVNGTKDVPQAYYIADDDLARWSYLKGAKSGERVAANGFAYKYAEGAIPFPDPLDRPSRTLITGEGGTAPSRTKHVVRTTDGRLRRLVPEELEALNGFPRGFTQLNGVSDTKRAFVMGNALVVGVVAAIGRALGQLMAQHDGPPHSKPSGASDVVDASNGAPPTSGGVLAYAAMREHPMAEVAQ